MNPPYKKVICVIAEETPSSDLCDRVMRRISRMEERRMRFHAFTHWSIVIVAFIIFIPAANNFMGNISRSEFTQYASLIFTDWSIFTSNWMNIILSLVGSWPILWSILLLGAVIAIMNSLRRAIINASSLSTYKHAHPFEHAILS